MRRLGVLGVLLLALSATGCRTPSAPPAQERTARLPKGVAAQVGSESISIDEVMASVSAQRATATEALRGQIRDTLFARGARARRLEETPAVRVAVRAELGRAVLEAMRAEAAKRPPTDAEVAEATALHYVELDRPAAFRVIHAVVLVPPNADPARRALARAVAEQVSKAVSSATTPDAFRSAAESVSHEGLECKTEELAPMAEDGRRVDVRSPAARGSFVPEFARAAARLHSPGQKSGVVETSFGYHVMMLLERIPPLVVPLAERRERLAPEIVAHRAQDRMDALVHELRAELPPFDREERGHAHSNARERSTMSDAKASRDEDRTGFTAILEDLVERSPGLAGVAFVARDGEAVDYAGKLAPFHIKLAAAHFRIVHGEADDLIAPHFGPVRQVSVRARERSFVVRALPEGYALVLVLARHALDASARAIARAERLLAREVGWPPPLERHPWHAIEVETPQHDVRRPQRIRAGAVWQPVIILGALVGVRRERGYRVRTASGAELTVVREASGHWYSDEAFSA